MVRIYNQGRILVSLVPVLLYGIIHFITTFITQYIDVLLLKLVLDYSPSEVIKIMYLSRGLF